nr:CPXCG motif-containing cysteine-rich protein [Salisaeta longa]
MDLIEHTFTCPYCWEPISMLVDPSVRSQTYVEDCEVCCRPIRLQVEARRGALVRFTAERAQ